jgi:hypothetical protein
MIQRAWEAPEEVVFPRYLIDGPGLQPEDIGVLAHLLLRDPGAPSSVAALATECQQRGWKVSEYAMRGIVKRLKAAGHIHQDRVYNQTTGRLDWVFSVYRNPANNQMYVDSVRFVGSQQIGRSDSSALNESAGQADSLAINETEASRWLPTNGNADVSAGHGRFVGSQRIGANPPHPPEEVETSSPYPLKQPAAPTEEEDFTADQLSAAEHFLQLLPAPWTVGRKTAQRLAPKLLEAITAQGWNLDDDLRAQLASNPDGIKRHASVLEKERIADLPLRSAVLRLATQPRHQESAPANWPAWCEDLDCDREDRRRRIFDDQGFVRTGPCPDCHPDIQTRQEAA